jgi:hypothetical protein
MAGSLDKKNLRSLMPRRLINVQLYYFFFPFNMYPILIPKYLLLRIVSVSINNQVAETHVITQPN